MNQEQQRRSLIRWASYEWSPPEYCRAGHRLDETNLTVRPEIHKWDCRTCEREKRRRHRESAAQLERERVAMAVTRKHPAKQAAERAARLKQKYGITEAEFQQIAEAQNGHCALCGKIPKRNRMTVHGVPWTALVVDHDHNTGCVRGLLCLVCNQGMGFADRTGLDRIAAYQAG